MLRMNLIWGSKVTDSNHVGTVAKGSIVRSVKIGQWQLTNGSWVNGPTQRTSEQLERATEKIPSRFIFSALMWASMILVLAYGFTSVNQLVKPQKGEAPPQLNMTFRSLCQPARCSRGFSITVYSPSSIISPSWMIGFIYAKWTTQRPFSHSFSSSVLLLCAHVLFPCMKKKIIIISCTRWWDIWWSTLRVLAEIGLSSW